MTQTLPSIETSAERDHPSSSSECLPTTDLTDGFVVERPVISVVVPYYNPGEHLRTTVEHLMRVLDATALSFEIITVSDGSTDGSPFSLGEFREPTVKRVAYATNVGKGHALRTGLAMSSGRYIAFLDADGDISPEFLSAFVSLMRSEGPDIVIGSKRHAESSVQWTPSRRFYSCAHQHLIRLLFRLDVKDTQVGIKLMDRRVVSDVLPLLRESRFALDLELLVLAQRLGYTSIVEAPVRIEERSGSTISLRRAWRLLVDTVGIFVRLSIRNKYDLAMTARPVDVGESFECTRPATETSPIPA